MVEQADWTSRTSPPLTEAGLEAWGRSVGAATVMGGAGAALERGALPLVLALRGPLGAGKSVLARAIARGAGVEGPMPSPTYNLLFTYAAGDGIPVHHLDLYRLEDPDDVWELGWEELGEGAEVMLIEWPERAEALLPTDRWDVWLEFEEAAAAAGGAAAGETAIGHEAGDLVATEGAAATRRRVRLVPRGAPPPLPIPTALGRGTEDGGGGGSAGAGGSEGVAEGGGVRR
jgi:tRNA threonylcarbamoyladenosine biosynthesis protein TsaE